MKSKEETDKILEKEIKEETDKILEKEIKATIKETIETNKTQELNEQFENLHKLFGIAKRLSLVQNSTEISVIFKTTETSFGKFGFKSYTIEQLYMKLQPILNRFGIILQYKIEFDKDAPINPLIYYPSRNKDINDIKIELTDDETKVDENKDVKDGIYVDVDRKIFKNTMKKNQLLGKTVVFYKFNGEWINADDKKDKISFCFPIPVELKDQMSFDQSLGSATTYAFRTNITKQFFIPTPDKDADTENFSEEIKKELDKNIKDNEWAKTFLDITKLDKNNPYVIKKESYFMNYLKPIYSDCNSYYEYLKFKYLASPEGSNIRERSMYRKELQDKYNEIYNLKTKEIKG